MKKPMSTNGGWDFPNPSAEFLAKHSGDDVETWRSLVAQVIEAANAGGFTKADVARRAGVAEGTFSQWASGKYPGVLANVNAQVSKWLDALEQSASLSAAMPTSPDFVKTSTGVDVYNVLLYAQVTGGFTIITLPSGFGKTTAARQFCRTRPHAWMATISPHTKTVHGMLIELASELEVLEHNPARLVRAIGRKLNRVGEGSLLIIDEAQNLLPEAVNQLRHFVDVYKCGVCLMGNEETAVAFVKDKGTVSSRAQVATRIDRRLTGGTHNPQDATALIAAWSITDPDCVRFLQNVATKPGSLRNIDRTIKAAQMLALGDDADLALTHLTAAWRNRNIGDLA
ncbi:AAA family ATPase [Rhizobium paknamense]|uniref:DNA transposition AAA+ family ATPase n=1 Tax=Rhizobium paknamense TaxID=1206817 RepID=A0ABU0I8W4_9HYPH|nr:AAA family ATPase [Rhizobium paknamense]MDQ0454682.1 DNA transposition AAA+ family ATPase [Rhizobium paknamense]